MKMIKKTIIFFIITAFALALMTGCGEASQSDVSQNAAPGVVYDTSSEITVELSPGAVETTDK
jgi:hypothetical protein